MLELGPFGSDPIDFRVELGIAKTASDVERDRLPALGVEGCYRRTQRDRICLDHCVLRFGFDPVSDIVENVVRVAEPALDVGPDHGVDGVGPERLAPAAAG